MIENTASGLLIGLLGVIVAVGIIIAGAVGAFMHDDEFDPDEDEDA